MPRFGRLPPDPIKLSRAPTLATHRFAATAPRPVLDRGSLNFQPTLGRNDMLPTCAVVGLFNAARMVAKVNGYDLVADEAVIPPYYAARAGVEDTDAAIMASDGLNVLDLLTYQSQHRDFTVSEGVTLIGLFGTLPRTRSIIAAAVDRLAHALLGVVLRERDMEGRFVLDVRPGRDDGAIVAGHLIAGWDYTGLGDDNHLRVTWYGALVPATWAWVAARTEEAYSCRWRQLAKADGTDLGVDADTLTAELAAFAA